MAISNPGTRVSNSKIFTRPDSTSKGLLSWLTTVDHKRLGIMYLVASFFFLFTATIESSLLRTQLMRPNQNIFSPDAFNQLFTLHGVTMVFLAIMPMGTGFANFLVPLMIGARDLAFPRLNAFGFWIYISGAILFYSSLFLGGAPNAGWFAYAPLTSLSANPGHGIDFYMVGLFLAGIGTLVTAMNIIVTIISMRAPGMGLWRMPMFIWMVLITMFLILFAFPPFTVALLQVILDRSFGSVFYVTSKGGMPILWQHLFWIFGHPEVYIIILPAFGAISEVIPTFSRKPLSGYPLMVLSGMFIGFMGFAVWAHHMFTTGLGPYGEMAFAVTSFVIGVPTGAKIFNWVMTMWGGKIRFSTSMLFAIAFLVTFTMGGITGIMVAMAPLDAQINSSYFLVAHFHYAMGGGALLGFMSGFYYWFPKFSGKMLSENIGKFVFALIAIGFHTVFFPQHFLGLLGMPRRIQTYADGYGFNTLNFISTMGSYIALVGALLLAYDIIRSLRSKEKAPADPWDARSLEWSVSSPPPVYDFDKTPVVMGRDSFWLSKYPRFKEISNEEESDIRKLAKDSDDHGIHMPGASWWPLITALALFFAGYAVIFQSLLLGVASAMVLIFSVYAWAFEGVGGYYIKPSSGEIS